MVMTEKTKKKYNWLSSVDNDKINPSKPLTLCLDFCFNLITTNLVELLFRVSSIKMITNFWVNKKHVLVDFLQRFRLQDCRMTKETLLARW